MAGDILNPGGTKVQYIYQLQGISPLNFAQTSSTDGTVTYTPTIPRDSFAPLVGKSWWYDAGNFNYDTFEPDPIYRLQDSKAYLPIFIPENIDIAKLILHIYAGPVYTSRALDGGIPTDPEYLQLDALKLRLGDISSLVPYTYAPLGVGFAVNPVIQRPVTVGTEVTEAILGQTSINIEDGEHIHTYSGDMAKLFEPGDAKLLEFYDDSGTSAASVSTMLAYAVLEGVVNLQR